MEAAATIGHNSGDVFAPIKARTDELVTAGDVWAKIEKLASDEQATNADAFLVQVETELKAAEKERKAEKEPILEAGRVCDEKWKALTSKLQIIKDTVTPRLKTYLREKQEKIDADNAKAAVEAQRLADEAAAAEAKLAESPSISGSIAIAEARQRADEAAEAVAAAPTRAAVKSSVSSRARTLRKTWGARLTNYAAAALFYRDNAEVKQLLERLASAEARGGVRTIPGFVIEEME